MIPTVRTVGGFLEYEGKFLILQRQPHKNEGNKWGLPAGKVNPGEDDRQTILREVLEETGYQANDEELEFVLDKTWHFENKTVEFPVFRIKLNQPIAVVISPNEHQAYKWVTAAECLAMDDLIHGLRDPLLTLAHGSK